MVYASTSFLSFDYENFPELWLAWSEELECEALAKLRVADVELEKK